MTRVCLNLIKGHRFEPRPREYSSLKSPDLKESDLARTQKYPGLEKKTYTINNESRHKRGVRLMFPCDISMERNWEERTKKVERSRQKKKWKGK